MQGHARCTHVQVTSATLGYMTRTVATQSATNTTIIFFLLNCCLLLSPHRLRHMRPRSVGLIPSLPANTKLSTVEQNTHMAMQLCCRACPHIANIGVPIVGLVQYGYITFAFLGSPYWREFNMATSPVPSQGPDGGESSIWGMENG